MHGFDLFLIAALFSEYTLIYVEDKPCASQSLIYCHFPNPGFCPLYNTAPPLLVSAELPFRHRRCNNAVVPTRARY